ILLSPGDSYGEIALASVASDRLDQCRCLDARERGLVQFSSRRPEQVRVGRAAHHTRRLAGYGYYNAAAGSRSVAGRFRSQSRQDRTRGTWAIPDRGQQRLRRSIQLADKPGSAVACGDRSERETGGGYSKRLLSGAAQRLRGSRVRSARRAGRELYALCVRRIRKQDLGFSVSTGYGKSNLARLSRTKHKG